MVLLLILGIISSLWKYYSFHFDYSIFSPLDYFSFQVEISIGWIFNFPLFG